MTTAQTTYVQSWLAPKHPGAGKDPILGALLGLAGPLGVAVFLRSLIDGALAFIACMVLAMVLGDNGGATAAILALCSLWNIGRVIWDGNRLQQEQLGGSVGSSSDSEDSGGWPAPRGGVPGGGGGGHRSPFGASTMAASAPAPRPMHAARSARREDDMRLIEDDDVPTPGGAVALA